MSAVRVLPALAEWGWRSARLCGQKLTDTRLQEGVSSESLQMGRGSHPGPRFLQEPLCASLMQEEPIPSVLWVPSSHSVGSLPLGQMLEQ